MIVALQGKVPKIILMLAKKSGVFDENEVLFGAGGAQAAYVGTGREGAEWDGVVCCLIGGCVDGMAVQQPPVEVENVKMNLLDLPGGHAESQMG
jgi:hypothetical protein